MPGSHRSIAAGSLFECVDETERVFVHHRWMCGAAQMSGRPRESARNRDKTSVNNQGTGR